MNISREVGEVGEGGDRLEGVASGAHLERVCHDVVGAGERDGGRCDDLEGWSSWSSWATGSDDRRRARGSLQRHETVVLPDGGPGCNRGNHSSWLLGRTRCSNKSLMRDMCLTGFAKVGGRRWVGAEFGHLGVGEDGR